MTGNIPSLYQGKTYGNNLVEDVEDDIYELPDSDFPKAAAIVFDKTDHGKDGVIPSSIVFDLIGTLGEGFYSE